jgi:hypothetical protein
VLVVICGVLMQWVVWPHPDTIAWMPAPVVSSLMSVDKGGLHPFRLISILALMWLTVRLIRSDASWLQSRVAAPFVVVGQHSLPVFCAGIFLAFLGRLATEASDGAAMQVAVNGLGAVSLWGVGAIAAWYANQGRARRKARPAGAAVSEQPP